MWSGQATSAALELSLTSYHPGSRCLKGSVVSALENVVLLAIGAAAVGAAGDASGSMTVGNKGESDTAQVRRFPGGR